MKFKTYLAFGFILVFLLISCRERRAHNSKKGFVKIDYEDTMGRGKCRQGNGHLFQDTLYLFFEADFQDDSVKVYVNGKEKERRVLRTSPAVGLADLIEIDSIQLINTFEIQINDGPTGQVRLENPSKHIWAVNFYSDTLRINYLTHGPCYE